MTFWSLSMISLMKSMALSKSEKLAESTAPTSTTPYRALPSSAHARRTFRTGAPLPLRSRGSLLGLRDQRLILADERLNALDLRLKQVDLLVDILFLRKRGALVVLDGLELLFKLRLFRVHPAELVFELVDIRLRDGGSVLHHGKRRQLRQRQRRNDSQHQEDACDLFSAHRPPPSHVQELADSRQAATHTDQDTGGGKDRSHGPPDQRKVDDRQQLQPVGHRKALCDRS